MYKRAIANIEISVLKIVEEIANIVKIFLESLFRVSVSKMAKEIANIVKVFLELVYQRWLRRSPIL